MNRIEKTIGLALASATPMIVAVPASALPAFSGGAVPAEVTGVASGWNHGRHWNQGEYHDYGRRRGYRESSYYDGPVWRGRDGRYRCRRSDGTTGLLIGGVVGGVIGHEIVGRRGDKTAGTIIGAAGGALIGRSIDRSNARCR
ncbi:MAG: glycine zipper 2TM domain-containing protein [Novosphingobium sp.]